MPRAMLQNVLKVTDLWYKNISLVINLTFFLIFDSRSSHSKPPMKDQTRQTIKMIYQTFLKLKISDDLLNNVISFSM